MDNVLQTAKQQGIQAELFTITQDRTPVEFENNKLKSINTQKQTIYALRVISNGQLGFSTSTKQDEEEELLRKALESAQFGRNFNINLPSTNPNKLGNIYDPEVTKLSLENMIDMGTELIETVRCKNSDALGQARIEKAVATIDIKNTEGFNSQYTKTSFSVTGAAMLLVGKSFLHIGQQKSLPRFFHDLTQVKRELTQDLHYGIKERELNSGSYDVIITPEAMGDLMRPIMASLNGQSVDKGVSPFKDKRHQKLFDSQITITDMPHRSFSPGMCPFDDEGVLTKETPLIKKGEIITFPVDLLTADSLGVKPTGHGIRKGRNSLPTPGLHTCVMSPGDETINDMIKGMKRGIIIKDLMGAWAGNPYSGEVNGNISLGYLVEDGKILGRVKDCMLSVNSFTALRDQLVGFSQEAKWIGNNLYPYTMLTDVDIISKQ